MPGSTAASGSFRWRWSSSDFRSSRSGLWSRLALTLAVAGAAHREARIKEVAISIVTLIVLSVLIFVVALKLPLRLWPEF